MRSRKRFFFAFALTLAAVAVVAFPALWVHSRRPEPPPREIAWDSQEKHVYLIQADASAKVRMGPQSEMTFDQTFLSRMAVKVLSRDESGLYAVVRLVGPDYRVMGQRVPLRAESPDKNSDIVLRFGWGGEILRVHFPADFGENEQALLSQLFLTVEIHLAAGVTRWEWRAAHDAAAADYRFDLSGRTLRRETLRYQNADAESASVLSSDFSCELSPTFWIDNVRAYEEKAMTMGFAESKGYLRLSMKRVPPVPSDGALWDETDDLKTVFSRLRQPARAAARSVNAAASPFAAAGTAPAPRLSREQIGAYLDAAIPALSLDDNDGLDAFIRFLTETPDAAAALPEWLLANGGGITDTQHAILMFALERCGSGEAQAALAVVASDGRHGELDSARAIVALAGVSHITDGSIRFLQTLTLKNATERDKLLANTAILNLGAAADGLRESDPFAYEALKSDLRRDLAESKGDAERSEALLKALGNIRDNSLVPEIAPYTDAPEGALRGAAYEALRFMEGDEPERLIRKGLASERDGDARLALSGALIYREPDRETVRSVIEVFGREKDAFVTNNMLTYIRKAPDEDGSVSAFLREAARNEALPAETRRGIINELRKRANEAN